MLVTHGARALVALALGAACVAGPVTAAPASAAEGPDCSGSESSSDLKGTNTTYDELGVAAAAAHVPGGAAGAGRGVDVFVVDSGVAGWLGGVGAPENPHGTIAASLIKGPATHVEGQSAPVPVGIAPGVRLHVVPAYSEPWAEDSSGSGPMPSTPGLVAALDRVANQIGHRKAVVVVPFEVDQGPGLSAALARLRTALVVAPIGDRPQAEGQPGVGSLFPGEDASTPPGQDAAGKVGPAADPSVLAVGVAGWSYGTDGSPLPNSDVDVAAPVGGGLAYDVAGHPCVVTAPSTDWAAAEVGGVAALTWSAFPRLSAAQLRQRLELTADGGGIREGNTVGYGVVQPLAAVTTPAKGLADGGAPPPPLHRAHAPEPPSDVLATTRHAAVWWGLFGGGALVLALLLRPLLGRRGTARRSSGG